MVHCIASSQPNLPPKLTSTACEHMNLRIISRKICNGDGVRPPGSDVTSSDVALAAGVSQSAVSRAFTPGAPISDVTRDKVLSVARDLVYAPRPILPTPRPPPLPLLPLVIVDI